MGGVCVNWVDYFPSWLIDCWFHSWSLLLMMDGLALIDLSVSPCHIPFIILNFSVYIVQQIVDSWSRHENE